MSRWLVFLAALTVVLVGAAVWFFVAGSWLIGGLLVGGVAADVVLARQLAKRARAPRTEGYVEREWVRY